MQEQVIILDFGSQYTQVIARRIRECSVYSTILRHDTPVGEIDRLAPRGIILSGGPASVLEEGAPRPDPAVLDLPVPLLGICYGLQVLGEFLGGRVERGLGREYGRGMLKVIGDCPLFQGLPASLQVWNSHGDRLARLPAGFEAVATTANSPNAVIQDRGRRRFGLQFHPEVAHTPCGRRIIENFLHRICGCRKSWTMHHFAQETIEGIRERVGEDRVILGLSGGVDSSVAAALIDRAVGRRLTCIFVDNGLLRAGEREAVRRLFGNHFDLRLRTVVAGARFLDRLKGVTSPEAKRKRIGRTFIRVFREAARKEGKVRFLAQGTLYPDVIESVPIDGNPAALIKSHHNVGGLPRDPGFELIEPLKCLFKDEVRALGEELGLPREVVHRQPFPGPGLAVRIPGEVTRKRLRILRRADAIVVEEMKAHDWYYRVWQSFAVLLPVRSVGVMGDERTYEYTIVLRVVESRDGMTADWVHLPRELIERIASRILNEVSGANRVCVDVSSKPPSTIEWE